MSTGLEVAVQTAGMQAQAALRQVAELGARVAQLESIVRAPAPPLVVAPPAAPAVGVAPAAAPAALAPDALTERGPFPRLSVPGHAPGVPGVAPWLGLLQSVLSVASADVAPVLAALLASAQGQPPVPAPGAAAAPPAPAVPPPPNPPPPVAAAQPGQPVTASELDWLAAEGVPVGEVPAATQTSALPPGYQHPPGVAPSPAPSLVVPMPPRS